jgi:hypothetical protein
MTQIRRSPGDLFRERGDPSPPRIKLVGDEGYRLKTGGRCGDAHATQRPATAQDAADPRASSERTLRDASALGI